MDSDDVHTLDSDDDQNDADQPDHTMEGEQQMTTVRDVHDDQCDVLLTQESSDNVVGLVVVENQEP
jgi:hypothetical protein